jgi:cytochrome b
MHPVRLLTCFNLKDPTMPHPNTDNTNTNNTGIITQTIRVWDPLVRILHWALAILVIGNLINEEGRVYHCWMGYTASAIVIIRIVWGLIGSRHAKFSDWFPTPHKLITYTRLKLKGQAPRYIGHNPMGAVMMLVLLFLVLNQGLTGYMMGTDQFFGEKWVEEWHEIGANLILLSIFIHILGASKHEKTSHGQWLQAKNGVRTSTKFNIPTHLLKTKHSINPSTPPAGNL